MYNNLNQIVMTIILRFEGLTPLPLFGSLSDHHELFLNALDRLVLSDKFTLLKLEYTPATKELFDLEGNDTILAVDIREKDWVKKLPLPVDVPQLITFLRSQATRLELLGDQISDTPSGAKRRTIMMTVNPPGEDTF